PPKARLRTSRLFSTTAPTHSMFGRQAIKYPPQVTITVEPHPPRPALPTCDRAIVVTGPRGVLRQPIEPFVELDIQPGAGVLQLSVTDRKNEAMKMRWGAIWKFVNNMIEGVTEGFEVPVLLLGTIKAVKEDGHVGLKLGADHRVSVPIPKGVTVTYADKEKDTARLRVMGTDKEVVGQFAAKLRTYKAPPKKKKSVSEGEVQ
ncbi:hypothetical protein BDK51DRAFT_14052, partial [Blyttiomyces helicus]